MTFEEFRRWLGDRGCSFENTEHYQGEGIASIIVRCGSRRSEMLLPSNPVDVPGKEVCRIAGELGLDLDELPRSVRDF